MPPGLADSATSQEVPSSRSAGSPGEVHGEKYLLGDICYCSVVILVCKDFSYEENMALSRFNTE